MPRTVDLGRIRDNFVVVLENGAEVWQDAKTSARRKTVAEDVFLRMVVAWEEFASNWFIGAVNHDASEFKTKTEDKLKRWLDQAVADSDYARHAAAFRAPVLALRRNPPVSRVRELLDPGEGNIEFRSLDELLRRSADAHAARFTARVGRVQGAGGDEVIDAALAIRNVLAHRSDKAVRIMNERVAAFVTYPMLRKESVSKDGIGTYLVAATPGGTTRLVVYRTELQRIAEILAR